ncbi:MAG: hypothetical protein JXA42_17000 [Anaerolineales bacterium]|nr:hypothetical protein [Anaerolineales bacterium]
MPDKQEITNHIGSLNEKPLHASLKQWIARPDDRLEIRVDGYVVDIVRDELLIEVQTGNFSAMKKKLAALVSRYPVQLVYPIAREKWIVKRSGSFAAGTGRQKSPKRGCVEDLFIELVSFPELMAERNFTFQVLLIQEEEIRRFERNKRRRRRGWVTEERRLLQVVEQRLFETPGDMAALLPPDLPEQFTTADLARGLHRPRWFAQKMAYCLRGMGALVDIGKSGRSILYSRADAE